MADKTPPKSPLRRAPARKTGSAPEHRPAAQAPAAGKTGPQEHIAAPAERAGKAMAEPMAEKAPAAGTVSSLGDDLVNPAAPAIETAMEKMSEAIAELKEPATTMIAPLPAVAEEGTIIMTDAIETTKKVAAEAKEKFQAMVGEFNEKAKAAVEKSSKMLEEMNEITKGNAEAVVESGKIAAKGAEALGQEAAEYGRRSFEKAAATMKNFASVKSPTEFFQLQSEFFSSAFDNMASEVSKSSEAMLKLAGDVVQPLSTRISVVSEKVKSFTL